MKHTRRPTPHASPDPAKAAAGLRLLHLSELGKGAGRGCAPIVWLALWSFATWGALDRQVWPSLRTLAADTGLSIPAVLLGLELLERGGQLTRRQVPSTHAMFAPQLLGSSGGSRRARPPRTQPGKLTTERPPAPGRTFEVYTLRLEGGTPNPRVLLPRPSTVHGIWAAVRRARVRPTVAVALAFVAAVWVASKTTAACSGATTASSVPLVASSLAIAAVDLRGLTGAGRGGTFTARLGALESAGVLARVGGEVQLVEVEPAPAHRYPSKRDKVCAWARSRVSYPERHTRPDLWEPWELAAHPCVTGPVAVAMGYL